MRFLNIIADLFSYKDTRFLIMYGYTLYRTNTNRREHVHLTDCEYVVGSLYKLQAKFILNVMSFFICYDKKKYNKLLFI